MDNILIFWVVIASLYGLIIGSFLNAVVWRIPHKESLLTPSRCPKCDTPIKKHHLIPVLSWVLLGGKCSQCSNKISIRYPIVELFTGICFGLFTLWSLTYGKEFLFENISGYSIGLIIVAYLVAIAGMIALALIDLEHKKLPKSIIYTIWATSLPLLILGLVLSHYYSALIHMGVSSLVMGIIYFIIWFIKPQGMGFGDVRLAFLIGALAGWIGYEVAVLSFLLAFALGAIIGISMIILNKANRKTALPFGPFMIVGLFSAIVLGRGLIDIYSSFAII